MYVATNPTTGEEIARYPLHTPEEIEAKLALAAQAFATWKAYSFAERAMYINRAAELLEGEVPVVAQLLTSEMGKTFAAAKGEVAKCAMTLRYYAEHAERLLADEAISSPASRSGVRFDPLGGIFAVMPWNFPLWQAIRFAAPALMAGNVGILKHASNVPGAALFLEDLFRRAGCPEGTFVNVFASHDAVPAIIADDRVAAVTLTGSERAGRAVAALAGQALKKCVLELGGSDPFVVTASADLDRAVPMAVTARVQNNGQSCIASKRFIVVSDVAEAFLTRFAEAMSAVVVGDPFDPATIVGPIVSQGQRAELVAQIDDAVAKGARVLAGGRALDGEGFFLQPTVLADVPADSRAGCEELFGPVAVVRVVRDLAEAIAVANETPWGLGAGVWATDEAEIETCLQGLEAGMVFVNAIVASTPELPFGGIKLSGYGRELSSYGIKEFVNIKTYYVA
jgi:succinate-semialdehyde dehydrogenase / glutarate-semialdehyde dehydrogenase